VKLARDILDKSVIDRHGQAMGRVDGIVVALQNGEPPRIAAIEIGPAVLGHRLHPIVGRFVAGIEQAFGVAEGRPVRVGMDHVTKIESNVQVDLSIGETGAANVEQRLRAWIDALPGGG
jgi:sporulation protein YlmC with PRC-barrel domain